MQVPGSSFVQQYDNCQWLLPAAIVNPGSDAADPDEAEHPHRHRGSRRDGTGKIGTTGEEAASFGDESERGQGGQRGNLDVDEKHPTPRQLLFFFAAGTSPELYTLSLHDALPI